MPFYIIWQTFIKLWHIHPW